MVHALRTIHDLLEPAGVLIDIRPQGIPAEFRCHRGGHWETLGRLEETDDFIEYRHAAWAMERAIDNHWFHLEMNGEFDFTIWAASLEEMKAYLDAEWTDAVVPFEVGQRCDEMGAGEVSLHDLIHVGVLTSLK